MKKLTHSNTTQTFALSRPAGKQRWPSSPSESSRTALHMLFSIRLGRGGPEDHAIEKEDQEIVRLEAAARSTAPESRQIKRCGIETVEKSPV